jgi:D-alanyl-D-alanine carboxypeptidase
LLAQMQTTVPFDAAEPQAGGYGLGISWGPTPCGRAWGHDGGVIGYRTQSFHSADGRRQVSVAQNIAYVSLPQADAAHMTFVNTALCGRQAAAAVPAAPRSLAAVLTVAR